MPKQVLRGVSETENEEYTGINHEIVAVIGRGIAIHDGGTPGGKMLEPLPHTNNTNLIRNGKFNINQNGTSWISIPTSGNQHYIVDGWFFHRGGGSTANAATSRTYADGFARAYQSLRVTTFSGGGSDAFSILSQQIDDVRLVAGITTTLSFWAKATIPRRIAVTIRQYYGSGQPTHETFFANFELTTEWQFFTATITMPGIGSTVVLATGHFTGLWFWLDAGSDYDSRTGGIGNTSGQFDIYGVKWQPGDSADELEATSNDEDLREVYKYYEKVTKLQYMYQWSVNNAAAVTAVAYVDFMVKKAKIPSITSVSTQYVTSPTVSGIDAKGFNVYGTPDSASSAARILGYTADAEITPV
jgi:hypothetical protein